MRVDLGSDQALVPEKFLDTSNIGTAIEQMRCETMTQGMGRSAGIKTALKDIFFQHSGHAATGQSAAKFVAERGTFLLVGRAGTPSGKVPVQGCDRVFSEGAEAFLSAFTADPNHPFFEIDVPIVHTHQFADPKPSAVDDFQDGGVSKSHLGGRLGAASKLRISSPVKK